MRELQNFINGDFVDSNSKEAFDVINPATEDVIASSPISFEVDVDHAYDVANKAFQEVWADTTPLSTLLLAEVAQEFLPPGVFNVVLGDRSTGEAFISHPTPELVAITGSVRAGMEVAKSASSQLITTLAKTVLLR